MAAILLLVFLNLNIAEGPVNNLVLRLVEKPAGAVVSKLSSVRLFFSGAAKFKNLVQENLDLKNKNLELSAQLAQMNNLSEENDSLRKALKLNIRSGAVIIEGGIFSANFSAAGYTMLLNKGNEDGISIGDAVASPEGVLVGQVSEVFNGYSKIDIVTNPGFKITVQTLDSRVSGMTRGGLSDGVYMDFVNQDENIKDGDVIVTSGNDLIPPALLVGKVSQVESNPVDLFKKVKISPAISSINLGRVFVIKTN